MPKRVQVLKRLTAQELSADLMTRRGLAFDQRDASPLAGERDRSGTACHSATEDENFVLQMNPIQIGRFNWNLLFRDQARRVVSSRQLRPRSTRRREARVKAMTPTAAKVSPRWLQ